MTHDLVLSKQNTSTYFSDKIEQQRTNMRLNFEEKDLIIDLRIGNDKKMLNNLFNANKENVAVANENARKRRNAELVAELYSPLPSVMSTPKVIELGKRGDIAGGALTDGMIHEVNKLSIHDHATESKNFLGGYKPAKQVFIDNDG